MYTKYPPDKRPHISMYGSRGGGWGGVEAELVTIVRAPSGNVKVTFKQPRHGTAELFLSPNQALELAEELQAVAERS